jgi:cyanophycin synthetase
LETFIPSAAQTPGRMNIFKFQNFEVLVDFAHNPHGMRAVGKFLERTEAAVKIGIISATGDRRDEDIRELGEVAAGIFDSIIVRNDKNLRGRTAEEIYALVKEGIDKIKPNMPVMNIRSESEAIPYAINNAPKGAYITICSDVVAEALQLVKELKEKESSELMEKAK